MSTNSTIAVVHSNGSVSSIYCHWDGYLSWNGKILLENYKDIETVESLVELGSLSILSKNVNPCMFMEHSFENPQNDTCVAYSRERDDNYHVNYFESFEAYLKHNPMEEYNYVFKDGEWYVSFNNFEYEVVKLSSFDLESEKMI